MIVMDEATEILTELIRVDELPRPIEITLSQMDDDRIEITVYLSTEDEGKEWGRALLRSDKFKWKLIFPE